MLVRGCNAIHADADEVHGPIERSGEPFIDVMCVRRECDGESGVVSSKAAEFGESRKKCRLASSETDSEAAVAIEFIEPRADDVGLQRCRPLWGVTVGAREIARVGECDGDVPRSFGP